MLACAVSPGKCLITRIARNVFGYTEVSWLGRRAGPGQNLRLPRCLLGEATAKRSAYTKYASVQSTMYGHTACARELTPDVYLGHDIERGNHTHIPTRVGASIVFWNFDNVVSYAVCIGSLARLCLQQQDCNTMRMQRLHGPWLCRFVP
jgi:hypothetical protein